MLLDKAGNIKTRGEPTIEEKVAFLSQPAIYPHTTDHVLVKETHMSWVFLVDGFVYKLKKPVSYDLFDHRSLKSRFVNCKEEVRINKILANEIYLCVVSLVINNQGKLQLEGKGKAVDWLVKMKRIPEENMLDYAIAHRCLAEEKVRAAAVLLAEYYQAAAPCRLNSEQYLRRLESDINLNYLHLYLPLYGLSPALLKQLHKQLLAFLASNYAMFQERVKRGKIIDAHGDLRPEHICLQPAPAIIDRLEFSKQLRVMDIAEELSYLSMECELLGNRRVGELFFEEYATRTKDILPPELVFFYKAKKAFVRAYLVVRHLEEERYKHDPKWLIKSGKYLRMTEDYLSRLIA